MSVIVLAPSSVRLHVVRATWEPGPPAFEVRSILTGRQRAMAHRVRSGLDNAGFTFPGGRIEVTVEEGRAGPIRGVELAVAMAVVLADPAHEPMRRSGFVAWGGVALDGRLKRCDEDLVADLPCEPWIGRFWDPPHEVPDPEDDAVITVVTVPGLMEAWHTVIRLNEIEGALMIPAN